MSSIAHHFEAGGAFMYPILFWQILAIAIIVDRAIYLYKASINREIFLATMQKCILAGDVAKAVKMCSAANAPLANWRSGYRACTACTITCTWASRCSTA